MKTTILAVLFTLAVGCEGFENIPDSIPSVQVGSDAAAAAPHVMGDAGTPPIEATDSGVMEMPLVPHDGDAGVPTPDAGSPAATPDSGIPASDAGTSCAAEPVRLCLLLCGLPGHLDCNTTTGLYDSTCRAFAGFECPVAPGTDAGVPATDAGCDAGVPPATDAGVPVSDAGSDAGTDAGADAGVATTTREILFGVDPTLLRSTVDLALLEERADIGAVHSSTRPLDCEAATYGLVTEGVQRFLRCRITRPAGTHLPIVGKYNNPDGLVRASASGWDLTTCDDPATTDRIESATPGMHWVVRDLMGLSLLPPVGIPPVENWHSIREDGYPVCRHILTF